jgi:uncharacterized membrane protein YdjX (TVP38/TMEM64 family)
MYALFVVVTTLLLVNRSIAFYVPGSRISVRPNAVTRIEKRQSSSLSVIVGEKNKDKVVTLKAGNASQSEGPEDFDKKIYLVVAGLLAGAVSVGLNAHVDFNLLFQEALEKIQELGPTGYLYFAAFYIVAEVLAIPAAPLTASAGYLFGLGPGYLTVLCSATIAATISFYIGRTFLRDWAIKLAEKWPQWRAVDGAINREGFKVVLLLRLSPLLPFALSNYLYGLTSVDFWSYVTATFLGFSPGTLGIVYAGSAGKV